MPDLDLPACFDRIGDRARSEPAVPFSKMPTCARSARRRVSIDRPLPVHRFGKRRGIGDVEQLARLRAKWRIAPPGRSEAVRTACDGIYEVER